MKVGIIVGGTGAQGAAVIRHLSSLNLYSLRVLTRNLNSVQAQALTALPNVTLVQSSPVGHDEASFLTAAEGADFAFINTDGFSIGEVAEIYWGIRFYELSVRVGIKHFIYSTLDNLGPSTGYKQEFHIGHYYGKSRVVEFLESQKSNATTWSAISSGPYVEMIYEALAPVLSADGKTYIFPYPLGQGAMPFINLDDFAKYTAHIIANPTAFASTTLEVATCHASGEDIAAALTTVTGYPAKYINTPVNDWLEKTFEKEPLGPNQRVGLGASSGHIDTGLSEAFFPLTFGQNFTAWWNVFNHSAGNKGIIKRDYGMLDKILPDRVRSVEEWMRKVEYTAGEKKKVLKRLNQVAENAKKEG
ncbi:hypothetical protein H2198_007049 [Neophaeococcomyces mojaviensis]|uniref:Uncharacterized protein n=1 Tax=Neophaeococcomyces mojaviensis TaxID=3383035 RepID=A0ACC3A1J8_9EURO|nr:hypothetical protein H2198_007049 [Knufia sp. JES_112]